MYIGTYFFTPLGKIKVSRTPVAIKVSNKFLNQKNIFQ